MLEEAWKILGEMEDIEYKMTEIFERETADMRMRLGILKARYDDLIRGSVESEIFEEGRYSLVNRAMKKILVDPLKFRETYPEIYHRIAVIPIKKAEDEIGKAALDKLCDITYGDPIWEIKIKK